MESSFLQQQLYQRQEVFQQKRHEGVILSDSEKQYLLPHFFMLVIGKPGSGKTQILTDLLYDKNLYNRKFDHVFYISPSSSKQDLKINKKNITQTFNFDWIDQKLKEVNKKQFTVMNRLINEKHNDKFLNQDVMTAIKEKLDFGKVGKGQLKIYNDNQRFLDFETLKNATGNGIKGEQKKKQKIGEQPTLLQQQDTEWIEEKLVKKLNYEQQQATHTNVLFVFDDVIGEIKSAEQNMKLAQLFLNRRHLIGNGTVSIIVVTQKYTMVPARIRSQASWIVAFNLNPSDFDILYKNVSVLPPKQWKELLGYAFDNDKFVADPIKKYNHLDIWVEQNKYFLNFNLLTQ